MERPGIPLGIDYTILALLIERSPPYLAMMLSSRTIVIGGATCLAQWVLWLGYTNNSGYREMIAGAVAAVLSTTAAMVFAVQSGVSFRFRWRNVSQAVYVPWYALDGTWEILHALARQLFTRGGAPRSWRLSGSTPAATTPFQQADALWRSLTPP